MKKIGLLGLGTVGCGVYEIIHNKKDYFDSLIGDKVEISKILVKNPNKKRPIRVNPDILTTDAYEILNDPTIDIIVEVMGGSEAYSYIKHGLNNGKHVVTANKAVVASHFKNLLSLSNANKKAFLFEASVGGGIPIIKPLKQHAKINEISEIRGILNGTTNFILSKMTENKIGFIEALKIAQDLGYAEADPTDDIEGYDAARKLAILTSIAFKTETKLENIPCRGIRSIGLSDIETFEKLGLHVKLMAKAVARGNEFYASTEPVLVENKSMFAMVKDAFNMISIKGCTVGELQFYGQGAGKDPTANAVVCDIIDILTKTYLADSITQDKLLKISGEKLSVGKYYLRITPKDTKLTKEALEFFIKRDLIYKVISDKNEIILLTKEIASNQVEDVIQALKESTESCLYLRIEASCNENPSGNAAVAI